MAWPLRVSDATFARFYPPDWDLAYQQAGDLSPRLDDLLRQRIPPGATVLDFGAGATPNAARRAACGKLVGVDVDPAVLRNPALHEAAVIRDGAIPYPDRFFDAAVAHWVFEHLQDPASALGELARVLKIGAPLIFITLNRRHWVCLISQCLPRELSRMLAEKLGQEPAGKAFETFFRLNTPRDIRRRASRAGSVVEQLRFFETYPVYFQLISPLFPLGAALERVFNRHEFLAPWRVNILGVLRRRK
jgi:SAM-dependent methyltransferase